MSSCARACASVRCAPTKAFCNVRVQISSCLCSVVVRNQYSSCAGTYATVRCAHTIALCNARVQMSSCTGACADKLMCGGVCFCAVRAHKGFVQCARVWERVQMSSCARASASVRCEPSRALCNVLVCKSVCR